MQGLFFGILMAAHLAVAASFGFFYAWSVSAMWGLDAASPLVAIEAMNAVNSNVQNMAFAFAFFGSPLLLILAAVTGFATGERQSARLVLLALAVMLVGVYAVTFLRHIPLNQGLMAIDPPQNMEGAQQVWSDYSQAWKAWNWVRTIAGGFSITLLGLALYSLRSTD